MTQSEFTYSYQTDTLRGTVYNIGVRLDPDPSRVESFAVVLFFGLPDGTRVQVAKAENSSHEGESDVHLDRYYRESGAEIKEFDTQFGTWHEAEDYLKKNWQRLANIYYQNHGLEPREDGQNV